MILKGRFASNKETPAANIGIPNKDFSSEMKVNTSNENK